MSHELLYTSAPQGLKPGSYGFCTVMATEGISKILQDRLESLSGYEPAFALTDPRAHLNPVNFSFLTVNIANQKVFLLSRIADAKADYTGRSNKLAHHVALQANELTAAGPATTLAAKSFCRTTYDNKPGPIPQGVKPPLEARKLAECKNWESMSGDAGWAGVLVEQTLKNPDRPITLIFGPEQKVLPLVEEAMTLLPIDLQWRTTFSTYFTKLPAGVECQWRFVLDGTPAADQARRNLQSPPIDLTKRSKVPYESPLVRTAQTGIPQATTSSEPGATSQATNTPRPGHTGPATLSTSARDASSTGTIEPYKLGPVPKSTRHGSTPDLTPGKDLFAKKGLPVPMLLAIIGGCVAMLTLAIGIGLVLATGGGQAPPNVELQSQTRNDPIVQMPSVLGTTEDKTTDPAPSVAHKEEPKNNTPTETKVVTPEPPKETSVKFDEVFKDVVQKGKVLTLPKRSTTIGEPLGSEKELCRIFAKHPTDVELKVVTTEILSDGRPRMILKKNEDAIDKSIETWTVFSRGKDSFQNDFEKEIGWFRFHDQSLSYEWNVDAPNWTSPMGLKFCKLDIKADSHAVQCSMTAPETKSIERISFAARKLSLATDLAAGSLATDTALRYDIELRLDDWVESQSGKKAKEKLKFEIPSDSKSEDTRVDLEVELQLTASKSAQFNYAGFVYLNFAKSSLASGPERFTVLRCDSIDDSMKEGLNFQDLAKIRSKAELDQKKGKVDLSKANKELDRRKDAREQAKILGEEMKSYIEAINAQQKVVEANEEFIARGAETVRLVGALESRLKHIEANLEVRFTVYLEFVTGTVVEKVVLVETKPAPSNSTVSKQSSAAKVGSVLPQKSAE